MKKQEIEGWKYYNHAAIPTTAPHEKPNMKPLEDGSIWKMAGGKPLFARYCTDWDCKEETEWWYVIKRYTVYFRRILKKCKKRD